MSVLATPETNSVCKSTNSIRFCQSVAKPPNPHKQREFQPWCPRSVQCRKRNPLDGRLERRGRQAPPQRFSHEERSPSAPGEATAPHHRKKTSLGTFAQICEAWTEAQKQTNARRV